MQNYKELNKMSLNLNNSALLSDGSMPCILCKKPASLFCQRCGDPYCSENCQKLDWQAHRYICYPMPKLIPKPVVPLSGKMDRVLNSHNNECKTKQRKGNLLDETSRSKQSYDQQNQRSGLNGNARRNQSNKPNVNKDGIEGNCKRDPDEGCATQSHAFNESIDKRNDTVNKDKIMIAQTNNMELQILKAPFKIPDINESDNNLEMIVLDTSNLGEGYIGCIPKKDILKLRRVQEFLTDYGIKDYQHYTPVENEFCIAAYHNEWFRARVLYVMNKNKVKVSYVDYTNEEIISTEDIRRYPEELTEDCCSYMCFLEGLHEPPTPKQVAFLKEHIKVETIIKFDSVKQWEDAYISVSCKLIIDRMNQFSLI